MKLTQLDIHDFRSIRHLKLDFRDELGRPHNRVLLVGPNASGKTTVLDAIAACLGPPLELPALRPDFRLGPQRVVRRGAVRAKVTCTLLFDEDEIRAVKDIVRVSNLRWTVPDERVVTVEWQYPYKDKDKEYDSGFTSFLPKPAWTLLKGRSLVARNLHIPSVGFPWFRRVGGVFTFDQQRTGMGKVIPRDVWQLVGTPEKGVDEDNRYTTDPKTILLALAVRSAVASISPDAPDYFELLRDAYAQVCAPHRIVGPVNDEVGNLDVLFSDGQCDYRYDGLSSGEQMVLLFLLRFVSEHIHRSIVLIDEIELHQHPLWQRKLVNMLPAMGEGNQFILTTHSSYLRDLAPKESTMSLGELGDSAQ